MAADTPRPRKHDIGNVGVVVVPALKGGVSHAVQVGRGAGRAAVVSMVSRCRACGPLKAARRCRPLKGSHRLEHGPRAARAERCQGDPE